VAEGANSSGTQRKGNIIHWKLLPNNDAEDTNMDTSVCVGVCVCVCVCVTVNSKV
jgi:hypothetical protein